MPEPPPVAAPDGGRQPPPLPRRLTDPVPVILAGSSLWALAALVLGGLALLGVRALDVWFVACLIGVAMGGLGVLVLTLQRRALARGAKGAQRVLG